MHIYLIKVALGVEQTRYKEMTPGKTYACPYIFFYNACISLSWL